MSDLTDKLDQWIQWWSWHRDDGGDVHKQIALLKRSVDMMVHLLALADLEIKRARGQHSEHLWLPDNLKIRGDLSRFG